jgi:hypothetical protein
MMTSQQFYQRKSALLTAVMAQLNDVETLLDKLEALEIGHSSQPDHDTLAISDLISDAYESTEALRDAVDVLASNP